MSDDLVTVATYGLPAQAAIARNALEAGGVESVVADAEIVAMDWLLAPAVGGVKVQVRASDAERAVALIRQLEIGDGKVVIEEEELARQAMAETPE